MLCEHLRPLEQEVIARGIRETYRGQAWGRNCREWAYFDCVFDNAAIRQRLALPACVVDHTWFGTHDGQENGFKCTQCHDGLMGHHPVMKGHRLLYR